MREAIDQKQVTIKGLADVCGCSRQQIYNIIKGGQVPNFDLAEKILNALGAEIVVKTRKRG